MDSIIIIHSFLLMSSHEQRTTFRSQAIFIAVFVVLGFIALQVPLSQLVGSASKFTLFDAFGPIAPAFIGTIPGLIAVFLMQFFNFVLHGAQILDAGTIIRFFPMLFAAFFFGKKSVWNIIIPALAMIAFIAHPIGRTVWYFSLYWTIPMVAYFLRDRWLMARTLGATFSAHAVGGALWIYAFNLKASIWIGLIPVVALERISFAVGIAAAYVLTNSLLDVLVRRRVIQLPFTINPQYVLRRKGI